MAVSRTATVVSSMVNTIRIVLTTDNQSVSTTAISSTPNIVDTAVASARTSPVCYSRVSTSRLVT